MAQQTYSISGVVNDENGTSLPGATVFISNTKFATIVNASGNFSLNEIPSGKYQLIIKMLGFNLFEQNIYIKNKSLNIVAKLTENAYSLNTVTIRANKKSLSSSQRDKYLTLFLKNFIGETVNAEQCNLLNPDVLNFEYESNKKVLKVSSEDLLVIENKALGYKLKYLMTEFELNEQANTISIGGYPYFEALKGTEKQQAKWEKNRKLAYLSSDRYFFKVFATNKLKNSHFLVYTITNLIKYNSSLKYKGYSVRENNGQKNLYTAIPYEFTDSLFTINSLESKVLIATPKVIGKDSIVGKDTIRGKDTLSVKQLYIVYIGNPESALFYKTGKPIDLFPFIKLSKEQLKQRQISIITPIADTVFINTNSSLTPSKAFKNSGYWAWQKIADLTPFDYFVDPLEENKKVTSQ
jgi:hypothetical protein